MVRLRGKFEMKAKRVGFVRFGRDPPMTHEESAQLESQAKNVDDKEQASQAAGDSRGSVSEQNLTV